MKMTAFGQPAPFLAGWLHSRNLRPTDVQELVDEVVRSAIKDTAPDAAAARDRASQEAGRILQSGLPAEKMLQIQAAVLIRYGQTVKTVAAWYEKWRQRPRVSGEQPSPEHTDRFCVFRYHTARHGLPAGIEMLGRDLSFQDAGVVQRAHMKGPETVWLMEQRQFQKTFQAEPGSFVAPP